MLGKAGNIDVALDPALPGEPLAPGVSKNVAYAKTSEVIPINS
jgi:hypothetical protein